jgi:hypothetical protein
MLDPSQFPRNFHLVEVLVLANVAEAYYY